MRWALRITAALLIGGVVTVAVSWCCALWSTVSPTEPKEWITLMEDGGAPVQLRGQNAITQGWLPRDRERRVSVGTARGLGLTDTVAYRYWEGDSLVTTTARRREIEAGWPCRALRARFEPAAGLRWPGLSAALGHWSRSPYVVGHINEWYWGVLPRAPLPTEVEFRGFVIDTLVCALALWFIISGGRWAKQRLRTRHGLCRGCGYPRTGLSAGSACPECGRNHAPGAKRGKQTA